MVTLRRTKTAAKPTTASRRGKTTARRPIKSYVAPQERVNRAVARQPEEKIREKAYDLYLRRGCTDGLDKFDWTVAETFVKLENGRPGRPGSKNRISQDIQELEQDIQKTAYELFEKRGGSHGNSEFDWLLAKQLVYLKNNLSVE